MRKKTRLHREKTTESLGTNGNGIHVFALRQTFGRVYQYLQEEAGRDGFINRRVGLVKDEHTDVGDYSCHPSTKAAVHLEQKDVESNRMYMNVYVEEIKYLFSIVQKLVLANYDETLNVEAIDSSDP